MQEEGFFEDPQNKELKHLTFEEAKERKSAISNVSYILCICLRKGAIFDGQITIKYELSKISKGLFLDNACTHLGTSIINGKDVAPSKLQMSRRINIPEEFQKIGQNEASFRFKSTYAVDGCGLHHYQDKDDNEEYVYTQFEAYYANRAFPCFDQPDLKAILTLITISPKEWSIISSDYELSSNPINDKSIKILENYKISTLITKDFNDSYKITVFKDTPKISTYLYSIIGGPFDHFKDEGINNIPMRIFIRKSLKKFAEPHASEFFNITKCGILLYNQFFGFNYPFSKYDQIYCPEFNAGAMENVGAVTYNELYVFKDPPTHQQKARFAITILHELSHMWFGNLVTMKWWNDLWLNESFATYISYYCLANAKGLEHYKDTWIAFSAYKGWAFKEDQMPTTHPIAAVINNTEDADIIFDGITYGKGASVIQQLCTLIGSNIFSEGLKIHFAKYCWKNAEMNDFLGSLQEACDKNQALKNMTLQEWAKMWLDTSGMNEVKPEYIVENGKITSFKLLQKIGVYGKNCLRFHKMNITLYKEDYLLQDFKDILIKPESYTEIKDIVGLEKPKLILVNSSNTAFCKTQFDKESLQNILRDFPKIQDSMHRMLIVRSLIDMTRDVEMPAPLMIEIARKTIVYEQNENIINLICMMATSCISFLIPDEFQKRESELMFDAVLKRLESEKNDNIKILLLRNLIQFTTSSRGNKLFLYLWLKGINAKLSNFQMDRKVRQSVLILAFAEPCITLAEKTNLIEEQKSYFSSEEMINIKTIFEAINADFTKKEALWNEYINPESKQSEFILQESMRGFWVKSQRKILEPFVKKFFECVIDVYRKKTRIFGERFFSNLHPPDDNEEMLKEFTNLRTKIPDDLKSLQKDVDQTINDMTRTIKSKNLSLKYYEENKIVA